MSMTRRELFSMLPVALVPRFFCLKSPRGRKCPRSLRAGNAQGVRRARKCDAFGCVSISKSCRFERRMGPSFVDVLKGKLATGESLRFTKRRCRPGARHIRHTITCIPKCGLIREGTVELTINGKSHQLGPGSAGFAHSNDEHGSRT